MAVGEDKCIWFLVICSFFIFHVCNAVGFGTFAV